MAVHESAVLFALGRYRSALTAVGLGILLRIRFVFDPSDLMGYYMWLGSMVLLALACLSRPAESDYGEPEFGASTTTPYATDLMTKHQ
jgi:hypothetical protein